MSTHEASRPQTSVNYVILRVSSQAIKTLKILEFVESVYSTVSFAEADFIWLNLETKRYSFKFKNELLFSRASLVRPCDIAPLLLLSPEARYGYLHPKQSYDCSGIGKL